MRSDLGGEDSVMMSCDEDKSRGLDTSGIWPAVRSVEVWGELERDNSVMTMSCDEGLPGKCESLDTESAMMKVCDELPGLERMLPVSSEPCARTGVDEGNTEISDIGDTGVLDKENEL